MNLPKTNGKIDTETVADIIFTRIANEIHAYNGIETRESNAFCNEMRQYIKGVLDEVVKQ